jgi:TIR domain
MQAWSSNANNIELNQLDINNLSNHMVETQVISDFLSNTSNKMFIIAPKGVGKTYLLKIKSQKFRDENESKGYKFIPKKMLCERFVPSSTTLSKADLAKFKDIDTWVKTWELCIYTMILKETEVAEIPEDILKVIGKNVSALADLLDNFLQVRHEIDKLHALVSKELRPIVRNLSWHSHTTQLAIFIDNVDEAVDKHVGLEALKNSNILSKEIWVNSQVALLMVAREVCAINHKIKFFLTIRSEAYNNFNNPDKIKIDDASIFLDYNKEQLRDIFHKNIKLIPNELLHSPGAADPLVAFLGTNTIKHRYVFDVDGKEKIEDIFDFIYRHTFGRPRDIMVVGQGLTDISPPSGRNSETIGQKVSERSGYLLEMLKQEIIPFFSEKVHSYFINAIGHNVIDEELRLKIGDAIAGQHATEQHLLPNERIVAQNIFSYYHSIGLLGLTAERKSGDKIQTVQRFASAGNYSLALNGSNINTKYAVIHPSLNGVLSQKNGIEYYDTHNVIGHNCLFNRYPETKPEHHLHFGIDRESLAVIIPEIASSKKLAITVPEAVNDFHDLQHASECIINLIYPDGTNHIHCFKVINNSLSESERNSLIYGWAEGKYHILVFTESNEALKKLLAKAQAISVNSYQLNMPALLKQLEDFSFDNNPHFYLCFREFDTEAYNEQKRMLSNTNSKLIIEPVIIDRFLYKTDTTFDAAEKKMKFEVYTESYCKIICYDKPNRALRKSPVVTRITPGNEKEFAYFANRHNNLVEALYRFYKYLRLNDHLRDPKYQLLLNEFAAIQIQRTIKLLQEDEIRSYFAGKSASDLAEDLRKFTETTHNRILDLFNEIKPEQRPYKISAARRQILYPSDEEFFDLIKTRQVFFDNPGIYLELMRFLEIKPLNKYKQVFIAYSNLDENFPDNVYLALKLMGVEVIKYSYEAASGNIKKNVAEWVKKSVDCLIISKNFIASEHCQYELEKVIEEARRTLNSNKYFCIRIDNYVVQTNFDTVTHLDQKIKNCIKLLKDDNIHDFGDLYEVYDFKELFARLIKIRDNFLITLPESDKGLPISSTK